MHRPFRQTRETTGAVFGSEDDVHQRRGRDTPSCFFATLDANMALKWVYQFFAVSNDLEKSMLI